MEYSIKKIEDPDGDLSYLAGILRALSLYSLTSSKSYEEAYKEFLVNLGECTKKEKYEKCVEKLYWERYAKYDSDGLSNNLDMCKRNIFNLIIFQKF